jgi:adenosylcobyric acid synthase
LANYDDLDPLIQAGVEVSWIDRPEQLGSPDLLVLPGSKNTSEDLSCLHERGLAGSLVELVDRGTPLLGICGGYQMLGEVVEDPGGAESDQRTTPGLGLLPGRTVLNSEKQVRRTNGQVLAGRGLLAGAAGLEVEGYEIHLGETVGSGSPLLELGDGGDRRSDGCSARSGWLIGTYLHGILHNRHLTEVLLCNLTSRRAEPWLPVTPSTRAIVDPYERLADQVEAAINFERLLAVAKLETLV